MLGRGEYWIIMQLFGAFFGEAVLVANDICTFSF